MVETARSLRCAMLAVTLVSALAGCGDDFFFCSDIDGEPPNCELCGNGRDDDLDGDVDCDDRECRDSAACRDRELAATTSTVDERTAEVSASTTTTAP